MTGFRCLNDTGIPNLVAKDFELIYLQLATADLLDKDNVTFLTENQTPFSWSSISNEYFTRAVKYPWSVRSAREGYLTARVKYSAYSARYFA